MLWFVWWKLKWCLASLQKRKNIYANIYIMSDCWILKWAFGFWIKLNVSCAQGLVENPARCGNCKPSFPSKKFALSQSSREQVVAIMYDICPCTQTSQPSSECSCVSFKEKPWSMCKRWDGNHKESNLVPEISQWMHHLYPENPVCYL